MNETLSRLKQFLKRPFFTDPRTLLWLWVLLALGLAGFGICAYQVS